ncbi:MAM and LDL-receptor class A domain-containing protein 1-like [Ruditapes philippinarum]|uniref:MAM and LDL-receptor class A domain-containing protein 1-like n=1 Tax=Ruditapes philippinarum TaxID=129788 RepID=UPI00295B27DA|nr:MAM and LDL-receptor class A domain-containing protein 1-like [Ruditapes philippinarum]
MVKRMTSFSVLVYLILNIFICKGVTVVAGIDCHFDMNFCDWRQDIYDDFNWTRGESDDLYTGPYSDHTTGKGYYIYVDSYNNDKGTIARLISPMQSSGQYCLTFWYSMYGRNIGALNVYIEMKDGNKTVIFSKNKDIGVRDWWKSVLNINAYDTYQIVIEGIIGDGYRGNIAIDDISIRSGSCSIDCDFNDDFCNWMQFDGDNSDWGRQKTANTETNADHTSGDDYYIYIATIGKYRKDTAILLSPKQDAGKYCLSFWYGMHGSNIVRLRLQIWNTTGSEQTIFALESAQGQRWFKKMIFLYSVDVFQVRLV